jgi:hypothetical protein
MVSRNGGWNMTDLKGEFLSRILSRKEREAFFSFLERANWLIFQDAYPQLLLYEESLKRNKPLFYLLPFMDISRFMEVVWGQFWQKKDSAILTVGLIMNEQSYLEDRVMQNPNFKHKVLNTFEFQLQDLLSFNQILFPYKHQKLVGLTVHQFQSLDERILIGKKLYTILFQKKDVFQQVVNWASENPHTGSRKDYWPHLFNHINEGIPGFAYQLRLESCKLKKGAWKIYSPDLPSAWKNVQHREADKGDWLNDWRVADQLNELSDIINGEIKHEYCKTLERLELAALAKKVITILD